MSSDTYPKPGIPTHCNTIYCSCLSGTLVLSSYHLIRELIELLLKIQIISFKFSYSRPILNLKVNAKILAWLLREAFNISLNIVISSKMK